MNRFFVSLAPTLHIFRFDFTSAFGKGIRRSICVCLCLYISVCDCCISLWGGKKRDAASSTITNTSHSFPFKWGKQICNSSGKGHFFVLLDKAYVRTLWRPTTNATFRLQGLTKEDQLVSMVRYSPLRAHILRGEWSNGCPANWKTERRQKCQNWHWQKEKWLDWTVHVW